MKTLARSRQLLVTCLMALGLLITSCGDGTDGRNIEIAGVQGPTVTLNSDDVLIAMVFENIALDGGLRYAIPKYNNSYIEISPHLQSGGTLMSVSVSLDDIFDGGLQQLDPQKLPGGRALPGVPSGSLPAVAFSIEAFYNMAFYLGPDVYGIFVPVDLGIQNSIATFRFFVDGGRAGNISLVGNDVDEENGGILLLLDLKGATSKKDLKRKIAQNHND